MAASEYDLRVLGEDPANLTTEIPDLLGSAVALEGDFNGDGYKDLFVGAPGADGPQNQRDHCGEAYVVFGLAEPASERDVAGELGPVPDLLIYGEETGLAGSIFSAPGDSLGEVIITGDLDADGYDDIVVAATLADGPDNKRPNTGTVYIFFGRSTEDWETLRTDSAVPIVFDTAEGAALGPDVVIHGQDVDDILGAALATGDVDGDGVDDLLVGASYASGPENSRWLAGTVVVFFGRTRPQWEESPVIDLSLEPDKADLVIHGAGTSDTLGSALASGADVNGDGVDDFLLGAQYADGAGDAAEDAGEAYLFFGRGRADLLAMNPVDLSMVDADCVVYGADAGDRLSGMVALWMADADSDGLADLILGALGAAGPLGDKPNAGETYVLFGRQAWEEVIDLAAVSADVTIFGADARDVCGSAVRAGDVNGDGMVDIIIGAHGADGPGNARAEECGETYVLYGPISASDGAFDLAETDWVRIDILGEEPPDSLGSMVAAGDFNGDGLDDVLVGAPRASGPANARQFAGEAYLILGRR
jgi:hypothetical protein